MSVCRVPKTLEWVGGLDGYVSMIDQTKLPTELVYLACRDASSIWHAIKRLSVRGAPAIGVAAAMGVVLGVRDFSKNDRPAFLAKLDEVCKYLATSRPTAVNLFWALQRMKNFAAGLSDLSVNDIKTALLNEAMAIRDQDAAMCRQIGEHGQSLIEEGFGVLTHCNAGSLATAEFGTALAPMYVAHDMGRKFKVFADETRPLLQGARLTVWELAQANIDVTLLCDGAAGALMQSGQVNLVITGADRIAANGDAANKIGTFGVAVLAKYHDIPFYVAAPSSTFDFDMPSGAGIPIEQRNADEIRKGFGCLTAPPDIPCYSPAFDVTPAKLIRGLITEKGLIEPVTKDQISQILS